MYPLQIIHICGKISMWDLIFALNLPQMVCSKSMPLLYNLSMLCRFHGNYTRILLIVEGLRTSMIFIESIPHRSIPPGWKQSNIKSVGNIQCKTRRSTFFPLREFIYSIRWTNFNFYPILNKRKIYNSGDLIGKMNWNRINFSISFRY